MRIRLDKPGAGRDSLATDPVDAGASARGRISDVTKSDGRGASLSSFARLPDDECLSKSECDSSQSTLKSPTGPSALSPDIMPNNVGLIQNAVCNEMLRPSRVTATPASSQILDQQFGGHGLACRDRRGTVSAGRPKELADCQAGDHTANTGYSSTPSRQPTKEVARTNNKEHATSCVQGCGPPISCASLAIESRERMKPLVRQVG